MNGAKVQIIKQVANRDTTQFSPIRGCPFIAFSPVHRALKRRMEKLVPDRIIEPLRQRVHDQ
jgi:hypothetical protein